MRLIGQLIFFSFTSYPFFPSCNVYLDLSCIPFQPTKKLQWFSRYQNLIFGSHCHLFFATLKSPTKLFTTFTARSWNHTSVHLLIFFFYGLHCHYLIIGLQFLFEQPIIYIFFMCFGLLEQKMRWLGSPLSAVSEQEIGWFFTVSTFWAGNLLISNWCIWDYVQNCHI